MADYKGKISHAGSQVVKAPADGDTKKGKSSVKTGKDDKQSGSGNGQK